MQDVIQPGFLSLVLAIPLLPPGRSRALAAGGAIVIGLALAGLRAGPGEPVTALPAGFLAVEGALFAGGAVLGMAGAVSGSRAARRTLRIVMAAALCAVGGLGVGLGAVPYIRAAPFGPLMAAAVVTAAAGFVLAWGGARLGRGSGWSPAVPTRSGGLALIGAGALLATASPWADLILVGAMLAAAGGWLCARSKEVRRLPVAPLLTLALLPAWWLMRTIAGPEGLATVSLPDLPWSPAAEQLLGGLVLLAAWSMSGLWPLHREEPAALTAPVAAVLMARVGLPAFPGGLEHWRALAMPVVLVGGFHGVLTGNRSAALAGLAWVGLATATGQGEAGAGLVLVGGLLLVAEAYLGTGVRIVARLVAAFAIGFGALLVTEAGLRTEVVYTVCAVAGMVAAAGRWSSAQASTASAVRATSPSA
jgi:hypothetical protein